MSPGAHSLFSMDIDPIMRAKAASALLDSVSVMDLEDDGTDQADRRAALALAGLFELDAQPAEVKATITAATDLIWGLTKVLSQYRKEDREVTVAQVRDNLLPQVYPEVFGP